MTPSSIDLVYLWVDGNDPEWQKKKQAYTNVIADNTEVNNIGRYTSNDELKYSLRSVEKYAPWIRKIFIVTDNQIPVWLNTEHLKIRVVDHKEIMPMEILPTFSSPAIEYHLHKIPGLAEHFLYANDDMFFNAPLTSSFFFAEDGYPIVRLKRKRLGKWVNRFNEFFKKKTGNYRFRVELAARAVERKFGKYYSGIPHHNIDAYKKSDYQKAADVIFEDIISTSRIHRIRAHGDLQRVAFLYYALAINHAHLRYVRRKESMRIFIHRPELINYLNRFKPELFCLNDGQDANQGHRNRITPFLEQIFTQKSSFEI